MKYHELTERVWFGKSSSAIQVTDSIIRKYLSEKAKELADGDVASEEWNRTRLGLEEVVEPSPTPKTLEETVAEAIAKWWGSSVSDSTIECAQAAIKAMREWEGKV